MGRTDTPARPPRGVTIRHLKDGPRLQIAFSYQGQQCREALPPCKLTKANMEYAAGLRAEIKRKIRDGTFRYRDYFPNSPMAARLEPDSTATHGNRLLLGTLLTQQQALYQKQAENGVISASTLLGYDKAIRLCLLPRWANTRVDELTPAALREWIAGMDVTGKTVRNRLIPLRSVLDDAVNDELIASNPLDRIALKKLIKQTSRKSTYTVHPFNIDEAAALLQAARADEKPMIKFWLETGLRPGEMLALSWSAVDWTNKRIRIDANIVTGLVDGKIAQVAKAPKTEAGNREIDLTARAIAALNAQKPYTFATNANLWHDPRKNAPWESESQFRKSIWQPLCARAGVRYRNPYQLRHTYASTLLTAGANPYWVAHQLGHVDVEMVFKIYGKFIPLNYQRANGFTQDSRQTAADSAKESVSD